ncbi:MORC family CW-type zinc finger protein 3a isoform X5 [Gadus chalcogrammus]|uniref:MORC family CW-type zinc finger protein 3a isoform X5 n=1 Tax=Gadus chalcogrammus TaxID=1042646 RepID=UPI0024C4A4C8|nr:MORC family CW-type zinc finger protein 3a isoform X5 [Gadus chalcogrammus]
MAAAKTDRGIPLSTLSTKFLHTNSTSHTGPFSAIAELIDNAYDPDAKEIWIDKTQIKKNECLTFRDNGSGVSRDLMHEMLSFGFSDKKAVNGKPPIGMYGNGFKCGSMRLGKDAIILSKSKNGLCVGMLSQTYLEKIGAKHISVPIISIRKPEAKQIKWRENDRASLRDILAHSPFNTEEELLTELRAIEGPTGTKIIIWNLRSTSEGNTELDFTTANDIRILYDDIDTSDTSVPEIHSSLRAYCSILYLETSMRINIRGQMVATHNISEGLRYSNNLFTYKPDSVEQKIPITFGDNKSKEHYGLMMYYKNRLIKAYHRVGCQLRAKHKIGIGVIGVIECNYLKPTHNKQDFEDDKPYRNTIKALAAKLQDYSGNKRKNSSANVEDTDDSDEMAYNDHRLQETSTPNTPQTSGEGTSGTKRPRRNCDRGESETDRVLRSSAAENVEISREELLVAKGRLTQEKQDLAKQIDELSAQVEKWKKETCTCKQYRASLKREVNNGIDALRNKVQTLGKDIRTHPPGPTSQQHH